jgi:hypothetical protein
VKVFGSWKLGVGSGWELGFGSWELTEVQLSISFLALLKILSIITVVSFPVFVFCRLG